jgi:hypothetical protein
MNTQQCKVKRSPNFCPKYNNKLCLMFTALSAASPRRRSKNFIHQDYLFGVHLLPSSDKPKPIKSLNM